ncbi:cytochrome P450 [Nemania sp. FL0916]|nr:cytochrome P450 [Nemania sp. FL0916]
MGYKLNTAVFSLLAALILVFQRQRQRAALIRRHGCEQAVVYSPWDQVCGFDFQMKMYMEVPFLYGLHRKHGNTYQTGSLIGALTVCTIDPENLRHINTSQDFGVSPMRLPGMEYFCGRGFITTDGNTWRQSRKMLKPSFELNNITDLVILKEEVDSLLRQLPKDGSTVDLQPLLYVTFLHSALHFVLGIHPSQQLAGAPLTADQFVTTFHSALVYSMFHIIRGRLFDLLPQKRFIETCASAHQFLDFFIDAAFRSKEDQRTRSLIQVLSAETDDSAFIRSQVIQAMMAAQDTTSELLTNALFLLARHPKYWQQLRVEFLNKTEEDLSATNLLTSKLVKNILYETLRIYPIFALLGRIALNDTRLPTGGGSDHRQPMFIPKGTMIVMSYYALHRDEKVFGDDVEAFRPERWDTIDPEQWEFQGFGGGNRACLGQKKALIEASYVLARLARDIETLESRDDREWVGELKMTCKSANGCKVSVKVDSKDVSEPRAGPVLAS